MKLCYMIMDKLKDIPEHAMYRIYTEELIKYIMKLTDEIDDIKKLEEELGNLIKITQVFLRIILFM